MNNQLLTFDPHKKKMVLCGKVYGDRLIRQVNSKHFMRVVNGYGIQEIAFEKVVEIGIKHITLVVDSTDVTWDSTIGDWKEHGKVADYGHGKQRFLSMRYMSAKKIPVVEQIKKIDDEQVSLMGVDKSLAERLVADKERIFGKKI